MLTEVVIFIATRQFYMYISSVHTEILVSIQVVFGAVSKANFISISTSNVSLDVKAFCR